MGKKLLHLISIICSAVSSFFVSGYSSAVHFTRRLVAHQALYSSTFSHEEISDHHNRFCWQKRFLDPQLSVDEHEIPMPHTRPLLHGYTVKHAVNEKRHIIFFDGSHQIAEQALSTCTTLAKKLKANVTCVSYPGVGLSGGETLGDSDLLSYGHAVVDAIRAQNPSIDELILYGYSFGGSVATLLAAAYEAEELEIKLTLINDRSFTTCADFITND